MYNTKRWHQMRARQLRDNPLCAYCHQLGRTTAATVADHIKPHKRSPELFYDQSNLQSLCKPCHDSVKQRQERTGVLVGGDVHGVPVDPGHHWHK